GGSFNPTSISTTTLSASGATTLSGAATLSGGGSLAGTFSGTPTFSGALTFTGALTINNTTQTQGLGTFLAGIWTHQNIVLSGSTLVQNAKLGGNISGTYTTHDDNAAVVSITNATDTASLTDTNSGGYPSLSIV